MRCLPCSTAPHGLFRLHGPNSLLAAQPAAVVGGKWWRQHCCRQRSQLQQVAWSHPRLAAPPAIGRQNFVPPPPALPIVTRRWNPSSDPAGTACPSLMFAVLQAWRVYCIASMASIRTLCSIFARHACNTANITWPVRPVLVKSRFPPVFASNGTVGQSRQGIATQIEFHYLVCARFLHFVSLFTLKSCIIIVHTAQAVILNICSASVFVLDIVFFFSPT